MNIHDAKWVRDFLDLAGWWAERKSKDPSSRVGCVIVAEDGTTLSSGYNGLPRGVADLPERIEKRPEKYLWMAHAEENAISNAARHGARLAGATAYVTHAPCARCAGMMVNAGLTRVYIGAGVTKLPQEEGEVAIRKLLEGGVVVEFVAA